MATKVNNSNSTMRKEKKVTSSCSSSGITHKPTNTRPATASSIDKLRNSVNKLRTTTASSADKLGPTTTTSSSGGKTLPNYLKPTCSSRISISVPVKTLATKTIKEDANQKNVLRRRSFDRLTSNNPPDPKERVVSSERKLGARSSSFSSRTPVAKPSSEKNSRSCKPLKCQATGTIKRSSSFTRISNVSKNGVCSDSDTSKRSIINRHDKMRDLETESKHESDKESFSLEAEEIQNIVEVKVQSDMQKPEEAEAVQESHIQEYEHENVKPREISIVAEEPSLLLKEIHVDNNDIELLEEEEEEKEYEEEENQIEEESTAEEGSIDNKKIEGENEKSIEKEVSCEEAAEEKKISEEDVVMVEKGNEEKETDNDVQKRQGGQGKKETPAAYNDVIEETKNKLLEERKNKVKALVGAFETVIDYETAGSNK